jgi:uncharacterized membrane protein
MATPFVFDLLLAAIIVEALTEALVDAEPVEPVRHWVGKWHPLLALLVNCGKCTAFWVALAASALPHGWLLAAALPLGAWRLAGLWHDAASWFGLRKELVREQLRAAQEASP